MLLSNHCQPIPPHWQLDKFWVIKFHLSILTMSCNLIPLNELLSPNLVHFAFIPSAAATPTHTSRSNQFMFWILSTPMKSNVHFCNFSLYFFDEWQIDLHSHSYFLVYCLLKAWSDTCTYNINNQEGYSTVHSKTCHIISMLSNSHTDWTAHRVQFWVQYLSHGYFCMQTNRRW